MVCRAPCMIWDAASFNPLRTLAGHEEKVMSIDIGQDLSTIISSVYDRTWKA
jgi:WD40 repeat protein